MPNDPKTYQFDLPTTGRPTDVHIPETWYPGIRDFWSTCTSKRSVHPINGIRAIVIHATAGGSSAGAISVMTAGTASFHWLVPDEDEPQHGQLVWACAPEALAAWHVRNDKSHPEVNGGKDRVNHWSLGIEIVNTQARADAFSDWQVRITAQIVRYCWAKYPNLRHIVSHARLDPRRRVDPGVHFPWDHFQSRVLSADRELPPFHRLVSVAIPADQVRAGRKKSSSCLG
jgi:N-acetylmuramoyl-L-alanine amidase